MRIARVLALLVITTVVVWALVLGWWQAGGHTPSASESLLYLVALPLALVGGFMLLNGFISGLKQPPAPAVAAPAATTAPEARTAAAERRSQLAVIAGSVLCAAGAQPDAILAAMADGRTPGPDEHLRDADGFPVFAARVPTIATEAIVEAMASHADVSHWPPSLLRQLALLEPVLDALHTPLAERLEAADGAHLALRLHWLPDRMPAPEIDATLRDWLRHGILADLAPDRWQLHVHGTGDDAVAWRLIDDLHGTLNGAAAPTLAVVLATASHLSEADIARWQQEGLLFTAAHQQGRIPGEAAAGLILAGTTHAGTKGVHLSRINQDVRDKSADAGGRISGALSARLCDELLTLADCEAARVAALVTDADHRASRQAEAIGLIDERFEALEPAEHYIALSSVAGSAAPATALAALVCAAHMAETTDGPVLALSVQHPTQRAAALLQPGAPAPSTS
ncbi:hypothetical protein G3580_10960 [Nitrogeniibacter mangrovi]|uniref:Uncharacterized protein n=2 Tax=Nitrogeniibacter mangrovi TaxID=2016596 RepID=A0A6C1B380_9RHOO|nr:hypothetical protein G3580_10960 [Nitrogeniibacter mangrovi]